MFALRSIQLLLQTLFMFFEPNFEETYDYIHIWNFVNNDIICKLSFLNF